MQMDDISDALQYLSIHSNNMEVSDAMLSELLSMMRSQKINSIPITSLINHLVKLKVGNEKQTLNNDADIKSNNSILSDDEDSDLSASFTFHSPSKPFTPFNVKNRAPKFEGFGRGPFTFDGETIPLHKLNINEKNPDEMKNKDSDQEFSNFFSAARSSIPGSFESPADTSRKDNTENKTEQPKKVDSKYNYEDLSSDDDDVEPMKPVNEEKAWFWGNEGGTEAGSQPFPSTANPSTNNLPPGGGFTIGATDFSSHSENKSRRGGRRSSGSSKSFTKPKDASNPLNFTFPATSTEPTPQPTDSYAPSFGSSYTLGASDILHSSENITATGSFTIPQPIPTIPKSGFFTTHKPSAFEGDLEDDDEDDTEMFVDEHLPETNNTTAGSTQQTSSGSTNSFDLPGASGSTTSTKIPTFPTFIFNGQSTAFPFQGVPPSFSVGSTDSIPTVNPTSANNTAAEPIPNATPNAKPSNMPDIDLQHLESKMFSFNLGTADRNANIPKSARKSARKKEKGTGSAEKPDPTPSYTAQAAYSMDETTDDDNTAKPSKTSNGLAGDTPPSWWTKSVGGTNNTHNKSETQPPLSARGTEENIHNINNSNSNAYKTVNKVDAAMPSPEKRSPRPSANTTTLPNLSTPRKYERPLSAASHHAHVPLPQNDLDSLIKLAETYCGQGKEYYSLGKYDSALEAYTNCLKIAPPTWIARPTVLGNRAAVNFMLNRYIESVNDCEDALSHDPKLVKLYIRKGKALIKLGHFHPAEKSFLYLLDLQLSYFKDILTESERKPFEHLMESARLEAKAGLREIEQMKEYIQQLIIAESKLNHLEIVKIAEKILSKSVYHRISQIAKANSLIELQKYDEVKGFLEDIALKTPGNIQTLYCHSKATFPAPKKEDLLWIDGNKSSSSSTSLNQLPALVLINSEEIVRCMLVMGSEMAAIYLTSLKNISLNRFYSADIMNKLMVIVARLEGMLTHQEKEESWKWVKIESVKVNELISLKNLADQQFKSKKYQNALNNYSSALKIDPNAKRWGAILFCNRAATHIALLNYQEAIQDCHHAIQKDSEYARAYLRRARAYRALNKFSDSTRDYRRYLCSDPVPSDFQEIQKELDEMNEQKNDFESSNKGNASTARPTSGKAAPATNFSNGNNNSSRYSNTFKQSNIPGYNPSSSSSTFNPAAGNNNNSKQQQQQPPNNTRSNNPNNTNTRFSYQQQRQTNFNDFGGGNSNHHNTWNHHNNFYEFESDEDEDDENDYPSGNNNNTKYTGRANNNNANANANANGPRPTSASFNGGSTSTKSNSSTTNNNSNNNTSTSLFSLNETDHYTILGIDTAATEREIKLAYRKLALQFHPDKNKEDHAEERFKLISLAYSVLNDKTTRRQFDLTRPISRGNSRKY